MHQQFPKCLKKLYHGIVGSMPTWVSQTFFQHSLAQSAIYIHTMHKAVRRTTNDEDDEHGLPQVQPGEITPDGVTWQTTVTWIGYSWKRGRGPR